MTNDHVSKVAAMTNKRSGFTLIEMLVAMALTLFIMVIVTTAFITGLETFRQLKAIGDMNESIRQASIRLRTDLQAQHFEGKRHLGDPAFVSQGKVRYGFVRVEQPTKKSPTAGAPYLDEGVDLDGMPSARAFDHVLHFSNNLRGDRPQDFYTAAVPWGPAYAAADPKPFDPSSPFYKQTTFFNQPPDSTYQQPGTYSSQWAEIAYFLVLTGWTSDPDNPAANQGTPLFALYRVERIVVPRNDQLQGVVPVNQLQSYATFSCQPDDPNPNLAKFLVFNTPEDLANGVRSLNHPNVPKSNGASLVLSNVVSFQVKVFKTGPIFDDLVTSPFDTAVTTERVGGLQITLRLWDPTTVQTRQVTIVQDM